VTRTQLEAMFRDYVQEHDPDRYDSGDVLTLMNQCLAIFQAKIQKVNPQAFVAFYTQDIVSGKQTYPCPTSMYRLFACTKLAADASRYVPLPYVDSIYAETVLGGQPSKECYTLLGGMRYVHLYPIPSANVTAGLKFICSHQLVMSAGTDAPDIHFALHSGLPLLAKLLALEGTGEPLNETWARLQGLYFDNIETLYSLPPEPEMLTMGGIDKTGY